MPCTGGTCRHRIYGVGGAPYEQKVNATGPTTLVPLDGRTLRRPGGKDSYNWYREVNIDCTRCGGKKAHRISLVSRPDDTFKRSEYLRQVPMTDEHSKRAYGFRPDAESGNRDSEEAWHLKRMPAWGLAQPVPPHGPPRRTSQRRSLGNSPATSPRPRTARRLRRTGASRRIEQIRIRN